MSSAFATVVGVWSVSLQQSQITVPKIRTSGFDLCLIAHGAYCWVVKCNELELEPNDRLITEPEAGKTGVL